MSITLKSNDEKIFKVDLEVVKHSILVKTLLDDLGIGADDEEEIPLHNVDSRMLQKVIEWCEHHRGEDPPPEDDEDNSASISRRTDDIPAWDQTFLEVELSTLFELMLAVNYMDVRGLMLVCCKTVANMIRGKSVEEVRTKFGIENDFTPEEEENIRKENEWCQEK